MDPIRNDLEKYPKDTIYGQCLIALARSSDPAAETLIHESLKHPNKEVAEDAAEAMTVQKGLSKIMEKLWGRLRDTDFSSLSETERNILSVRMLIDEVNNGGFLQYLFNSSGDHVQDALRGLQAIKAHETERILGKAVMLFDNGPAPKREERMKQLEKLSSKADEQLSGLDSEFYKDADNREAKLQVYIASQSDHLKALPNPNMK
jgi:hypothetical protein